MGEANGHRQPDTSGLPGPVHSQHMQPSTTRRLDELLGVSTLRTKKRVRIEDDVDTFCHSSAWPEPDYKRARRGTWIGNRVRFQRRVVHLSMILTPFLTDEHRILVRLRNMMCSD